MLAVNSLINTTHNALFSLKNRTIFAGSNLVGAIATAHVENLTNKTNAFLVHLDTKKEVVANLSAAFITSVQDLVNSTVSLAATHITTHISLTQAIVNATLQAKVEYIEAKANATQQILVGFSTLLEQKLIQKQLFLGNISILIQNITDAKVQYIESKINTTSLFFEAHNNKTIIICDAIESILGALVNHTNASAVAFVAHTTLLLDTVSDIVVSHKNFSGIFFANKTETLLTSLGDIFSVLANSSTAIHESFVDKFNASITAFTDSLVDISDSLSYFKANVTQSFSEKVDGLLTNKATLHSNISDALTVIHYNISNAISIKIYNFTQNLQAKLTAKTLRSASAEEKALLDTLNSLIDNVSSGVSNFFDKTHDALNRTLTGLNDKFENVVEAIESLKHNFTIKMDSSMTQFTCARDLIPDFVDFIEDIPEHHAKCSMNTITEKLNELTATVMEITNRIEAEYNEGFGKYEQCLEDGTTRSICLSDLVALLTKINLDSLQYLIEANVDAIATQLDISSCIDKTIEEAESDYLVIIVDLNNCVKK